MTDTPRLTGLSAASRVRRQTVARPLEVWHVDLAASGTALCLLELEEPRLSEEERRWSETGLDGCRRATRIALRLLLERALTTADALALRRTPLPREAGGRPRLPQGLRPAFSLSHCGSDALVAISQDGPVGIDLEAPRRLMMPTDRRRAIVAAAATLGPWPQHRSRIADDDEAVLVAWTRLEAVGKAHGTGVAAVLAEHGVLARGAGREQVAEQAPLAVDDLPLPRGLFAAIARAPHVAVPAIRRLPAEPDALARLTDQPC